MGEFFSAVRIYGRFSFEVRKWRRSRRSKLWFVIMVGLTAAVVAGFMPPSRSLAADRQEIIEERTENTKTFKNSDGTTTIEFSADPLHYLDANAAWQDIDTNIAASNPTSTPTTFGALTTASPSYPQYSVTKNTYKAYFGDTLAEPIRFEFKGKSVEFYPLNYATPSVTVVKNAITYTDAWKDADLEYTVTPGQLKEKIILKSAAVVTTYSFLVKPFGVTVVQETDGSISMYDTTNSEKLWYLPVPYVIDSAVEPQASDTAVTMTLRQEGENQYIDLSVDPVWLNSVERQFPVTIDPPVTLGVDFNPGNTSKPFTIDYPQVVTYHAYLWGHKYWFFGWVYKEARFSIYAPGNWYGSPAVSVAKSGWGGEEFNGSFWATPGTWLMTIGRDHSYAGGWGSVTYRTNVYPTYNSGLTPKLWTLSPDRF